MTPVYVARIGRKWGRVPSLSPPPNMRLKLQRAAA